MSERESAMICVDNSEWMRNGDLVPTRLQCQQEAVNLVLQCKLRANPENGVGLLSMADRVEVLSSMTREERKLFIKLHEVQITGHAQILNAIKIAHLALRHRQNRNHRMRIIMFIGSPIENIEKFEFIKLAKKLKKEKVNVDFVCFGEATSDDNQVLAEFVDTLNGKDSTNSNILVVSAGSKLIDALVTSAICRGEGGNNMAVVGANGAVDFGVDADEDPELALALRVSLEEQRQRQRQEVEQNNDNASNNAASEEIAEDRRPAVDASESDADAAAAVNVSDSQQVQAVASEEGSGMFLENMTEEEQLAWALRMSVTDNHPEEKKSEASTSDERLGRLMENPELLQQIIDDMANETEAEKKSPSQNNVGKDDKS